MSRLVNPARFAVTGPPPGASINDIRHGWEFESAQNQGEPDLGAGATHPLTQVNEPLSVSGRVNNARQMADAPEEDYLYASNLELNHIANASALTFSMWMKIESTLFTSRCFAIWGSARRGFQVNHRTSAGFQFEWQDLGGLNRLQTGSGNGWGSADILDVWCHCMAWWDGADLNVEFYRQGDGEVWDGSVQAGPLVELVDNDALNMAFGRNNQDVGGRMIGPVDSTYIWLRVLTAQERAKVRTDALAGKGYPWTA